MLHTRH